MRTAYRCRAYPDSAQQAVLNRTFGCVRVVWNQTLAARQQQYVTDRTTTSYAQTDRALTAIKKDPAFALRSTRLGVKDFAVTSDGQMSALRSPACRHRPLVPLQQDLLSVRAPPGRTEPFHPGVAMSVLRHRA
jgi:hypothetical protein